MGHIVLLNFLNHWIVTYLPSFPDIFTYLHLLYTKHGYYYCKRKQSLTKYIIVMVPLVPWLQQAWCIHPLFYRPGDLGS